MEWARREAPPGACWFVVPSPSGQRIFRQRGWLGFRSALAPWAASRGADPDRTYVVRDLPPADGDPSVRPTGPQLLGIAARGGTGLDIALHVPYELAIFRGHFSTVPIVPGAMLVGWAAELAATHAHWRHGACRSVALKFRRIVQPGPPYTLRLDWAPDGARLQFRVQSAAGLHAEGSLLEPLA